MENSDKQHWLNIAAEQQIIAEDKYQEYLEALERRRYALQKLGMIAWDEAVERELDNE